MAAKHEPRSSPDDKHFLEEVRHLLASARRSREEAQSYAEGIVNRELKKQAQELLDAHDEGY